MQSRFLWPGILVLIMLLCCPMISAASDEKPVFTVVPFVEYDYLADMGGAEDVLDRVNTLVGGWLRGYENIDLFQHLLLVGAEVRMARPEFREGLSFFTSLAGTAGSAGMLGEDYDRQYDLRTIPVIPGIMDAIGIPIANIDGRVHIQIDQYLDYYIPLQVGVRYEPYPERPLSFFCSLSGGVLFFKGGMDVDVDMAGTVAGITVNGETAVSYRGRTEMKDMGWTMSALAGLRYRWKPGLSSSVAMGLGLGRLKDNVDISGTLSGNVSLDTLLADLDTPFSMNLDNTEPIDFKVDGWRVRLGLVEWQW